MPRKKVTSFDEARTRRGLPVERWRRGIHAVLVTKPKAGKVVRLKRK